MIARIPEALARYIARSFYWRIQDVAEDTKTILEELRKKR